MCVITTQYGGFAYIFAYKYVFSFSFKCMHVLLSVTFVSFFWTVEILRLIVMLISKAV